VVKVVRKRAAHRLRHSTHVRPFLLCTFLVEDVVRSLGVVPPHVGAVLVEGEHSARLIGAALLLVHRSQRIFDTVGVDAGTYVYENLTQAYVIMYDIFSRGL
jgi:hypothetical protein